MTEPTEAEAVFDTTAETFRFALHDWTLATLEANAAHPLGGEAVATAMMAALSATIATIAAGMPPHVDRAKIRAAMLEQLDTHFDDALAFTDGTRH